MAKAYKLQVTREQERELEQTRDHGPKPYLRERAAILLSIVHGQSIRAAAASGGLKPHHHDSVGRWVAHYQAEGVAGLVVRKGRGRKPAWFPAAH